MVLEIELRDVRQESNRLKKAEEEKLAKEEDDRLKERARAIRDFYRSIPTLVGDLSSSLADLSASASARELALFNFKNETEAKARSDAHEDARKKIEETVSDKGDRDRALIALDKATAIAEKDIAEDLEIKKRKLQYDSALLAWKFKLAGATASGAQAQVNAWATNPFPVSLVVSALAATATILSLATINNAKPIKNFKTGTRGFTVPDGFDNDSFGIGLTSREEVTVKTPTQQIDSGEEGMLARIDIVVDSNVAGSFITELFRSRKSVVRMEDIL